MFLFTLSSGLAGALGTSTAGPPVLYLSLVLDEDSFSPKINPSTFLSNSLPAVRQAF